MAARPPLPPATTRRPSGGVSGQEAVLHFLRRDPTLVFERGLGSRLWDHTGREYLDAISGTNGPAAVGHSHPAVAAAVAEQMRTLPSSFIVHDNVPLLRFCERVAAIAPGDLSRAYLCPGGGEAVEAAVKLAMRVTGRAGAVSLQGAYHGMSIGTMALGGIPDLREWLPDGARIRSFRQVPGPDTYRDGGADWAPRLAALEDELDRELPAAVIMELVQGPNGHVELPGDYCRGVANACRARGVIFIVDEVQTALGRCGSFWASDLVGVEPDIVVVGKAFGGGVPFGALIAAEQLVSEALEADPWHILTFANQPLQAAAGLAVLDVVDDERLVERARHLGDHARVRLGELAERYAVIGDVRGPGLFIGVDLVSDRETREPATAACREAWGYALEQGLVTWFGGAGNVLKLKPPLTTPDDDLDLMLDRIERVVAFVERRVHGRTPGGSAA
jgi:4-aminobutyrate aminotransferase-like enzyme